jgi:hypothetical protein
VREILILAVHLPVTLAKLLRPGGVFAGAAESLLLKHRLLSSNRSRSIRRESWRPAGTATTAIACLARSVPLALRRITTVGAA